MLKFSDDGMYIEEGLRLNPIDEIADEISALHREIFIIESGMQPGNYDRASLKEKKARLAELESAFNVAHGI